jgi:hypothetical protein
MRRIVSMFLWAAGLVLTLQLQVWAAWTALTPVVQAGNMLAGQTGFKLPLAQALKTLGTRGQLSLESSPVPALPPPWKRILRTFANSA